MKPATRDAIISEMDRLVQLAGSPDYDSGMAVVQKCLDWFQGTFQPMRSKADFAAFPDALPEPSSWRRLMLLSGFKYTPQLLRFALTRISQLTEELPQLPKGRPGLTAFDKAQIVAHIGKRFVAGYTLEQAKNSASIQFELSLSTVQRAWDDRANRGAVDFRSVLQFIAENSKDQSDVLDWMDRQH